MKPYYNHKGIQIYHGDCRDILPQLEPVDLVLTDPPYGIDYNPSWKKWDGTESNWEKIKGDNDKFNPVFLFNKAEKLILFGAEHYADLLPIGGWIIWDKRVDAKNDKMFGNAFEMAWINRDGYKKIIRIKSGGVVNPDSEHGNNEKRFHPTQKPLDLFRQLIEEHTTQQESILDAYLGSGTTLVAAKQLGRKAIGIEIEEKYCEIAARRLSQEMLPFA